LLASASSTTELGSIGSLGLSAAHSFLTPVTAIGFDLVGILPAGFAQGPPSADFFGFSFAGTQVAIPLGSDPIFFGATFDTPQTTIPAHVVPGGVSGPQDGFVITNLAVRTVPEPATLALFGAAAALLLGADAAGSATDVAHLTYNDRVPQVFESKELPHAEGWPSGRWRRS
jgi:hypothetical protein